MNKGKIIWLMVIIFLSYTAFLYASLPSESGIISTSVYSGKQIWQKNNCGSCHQVYGLGGYLGPDLTNVYSTKGETVIRSLVQYGTSVMPSFKLGEKDLNDLVMYLKSVDASGTSDPRSFKINYDGSISQ